LKQNRLLIQDLVDGGLRLASAEDSLKRALCCSDLAGSVAFEIRKAAEEREGARAAEMGEHFQALLQHGIADNLNQLRAQTPPGSSQDLEMRRLAEQVAKMAQPVEQQLQKVSASDPEDMHHALQAVQGGRTEVEKSLALPGSPREISTRGD
jgi:SAM-dependent MidA family methyltransferase